MIVMILVVSIETLIKYSIWHMLVYFPFSIIMLLFFVCAWLVRGANNFWAHCIFSICLHVCKYMNLRIDRCVTYLPYIDIYVNIFSFCDIITHECVHRQFTDIKRAQNLRKASIAWLSQTITIKSGWCAWWCVQVLVNSYSFGRAVEATVVLSFSFWYTRSVHNWEVVLKELYFPEHLILLQKAFIPDHAVNLWFNCCCCRSHFSSIHSVLLSSAWTTTSQSGRWKRWKLQLGGRRGCKRIQVW